MSYTIQDLFDVLTDEEIYFTLKPLTEDDCYVVEFLDGNALEYVLQFLINCDAVWITSDNRVLLTQKGERVLQYTSQAVELDRKPSKVKRKNYGKK